MKCLWLISLTMLLVAGGVTGQQLPGTSQPTHYSQGGVYVNFTERIVSEEGDALHDKYHDIVNRVTIELKTIFSNNSMALVGDWSIFAIYRYGDDSPGQKVIDITAVEARNGARVLPVYTLTMTPQLNTETASQEIVTRILKAAHTIPIHPPAQVKSTKL